jgi:RNA polymerase sigma-70 factor (ECF subfamily)
MTNTDLEDASREMHAPLPSFIARRVSDRRDAEDVLQEVMLRIHRHARETDRFEHLGAWVHRVARNAVVDLYRRRAARPELPPGSGADVAEAQPLAALDRPPSAALRSELAACLTPLLGRLPDTQREALELTEFEGLRQVAAADRLGLSNSGMNAAVATEAKC